MSTDEQTSFVDEALDQIKLPVLDSMSNILINHHGDQQLEWDQTVDLQRLVNAMSFACLNHLGCWAGLRES